MLRYNIQENDNNFINMEFHTTLKNKLLLYETDYYCTACQKREKDRTKNNEKYCDFPRPRMIPLQVLIHSKVKIVHDILLRSTNPDYKDLAHRLE